MVEDKIFKSFVKKFSKTKDTANKTLKQAQPILSRIRQDMLGLGWFGAGIFGYHIFSELNLYPLDLLIVFVGYYIGVFVKLRTHKMIDYGGWVAALWLGIATLQFTVPDVPNVILFVLVLHWLHTYVFSDFIDKNEEKDNAQEIE
ncbi:hypothetical protein KC573_00175 [candidate division WWE3 bacterium]|uniref:Uncharacterized protein n=1 Tax=candidate division WWE3 bacterium TaxID=2053526 RepID=A0A955LVC3_UNCKA|nr:hypothetical protein [candidate division WWE3 bacterium]